MEKKDFLYQSDFDPEHCIRSYRDRIKSSDLLSFQVKEKESDLLVQTPVLLQKEALTSLDKHKVAIHIKLCDSKKDDVEKFLQENNVPFTSITAKGESPEGKDEKGEKKNDSTVTVVDSAAAE